MNKSKAILLTVSAFMLTAGFQNCGKVKRGESDKLAVAADNMSPQSAVPDPASGGNTVAVKYVTLKSIDFHPEYWATNWDPNCIYCGNIVAPPSPSPNRTYTYNLDLASGVVKDIYSGNLVYKLSDAERTKLADILRGSIITTYYKLINAIANVCPISTFDAYADLHTTGGDYELYRKGSCNSLDLFKIASKDRAGLEEFLDGLGWNQPYNPPVAVQ